ncbi:MULTISPECIES: rhodanese-like domain-containing protein [unclassified Butyrivibrio]|uniref:rhodanese-like domain-containing protein n=1 Tax=unclassified Butyrivibrio TaxID=2639466 RepID=UPI0003B31928|nr:MULTISPECIES: rhodanese-like domain-containing protein [unclassified Butyrivibrio]MDC7292862.1 rhodanese-like domain-containing protein [Butyrivibrio sp. DSM 10294]
MGLKDLIKRTDINSEIEKYKATAGAVLLDVRTEEEYKNGHIPGSINLPVEEIQKIEDVITDKNVPVFVYCLRGGRAGRAVKIMQTFGYKDVKNIGGIMAYKGLIVK